VRRISIQFRILLAGGVRRRRARVAREHAKRRLDRFGEFSQTLGQLRAAGRAAPAEQALLTRLDQQPARSMKDAPMPRAGRHKAHRRRTVGGLVTIAAVVIAVAVGVGAVVLLGHGSPAPQPNVRPSGHAAISGRQELISMLGVLRRPQTSADINRKLLHSPYPLWLQGMADVPLMRLVITAWGEKLNLVAIKPPSVGALRSAWKKMNRPFPLRQYIAARDVETLSLFTNNGGGGGRVTAADLQYLGSDAFEGARTAGLKPSQGGYQYLIRVVPDGVTKVAFVVRGHLGPLAPGTANPPPTKVTAIVHDNVAAARITRQESAGNFEAIWYAKNGHILKRSFWP